MVTTTGESGELYYDPFDYEVDARAHAVWKRMRDEAPVYYNEKYDFWALSRYDDVLEAITDTARLSSRNGITLDMIGPEPVPMQLLIMMDPPEHSWHRRVVNRAFTPRAIANLDGRVVEVCTELLDKVEGQSQFDVVQDFAAILPPTMILALVGLPGEIVDRWRQNVDEMLKVDTEGAGSRPMEDPTGGAGAILMEVLPDQIEERRRSPRDDLLSVLANTDLDEGGSIRKLTEEEIFYFVMLLAGAGTETVARNLGWIAVLLDQHPDQRAMLAADPTLIDNAVEESLRFEAPSPVQGRWSLADLEFQGQAIPKGSKVLLLNGSANRDERHFANPDVFDITRKIDRHLSFGYGAHFCVGAALARLESQIGLRELLKRYPEWHVDYSKAEMVHTASVRGYASVPVSV